jgi:hypothetical protein
VVCVIITAIVVLKSYDSAFVTRNAVAQTHSETQKYDNQTSTSQQANIQFIIDENETPFLAKMHHLYENNDNKLKIVLLAHLACVGREKSISFIYSCTDEDMSKILSLAEQGDLFSIAFMSMGIGPYDRNRIKWSELAVEKGEPVHVILYGDDYSKIEEILNKHPKLKTNFEVFSRKTYLYLNSLEPRFCETAKEGYKLFGLKLIAGIFLYRSYDSSLSQIECDLLGDLFGYNKTREEILDELDTNESRFIKANLLIMDQNERDAARIFEELYVGDDTIVSINAGYCLGIMKYYGRGGYAIDEVSGLELVNEAVGKGIFFTHHAFPQLPILFPKTGRITFSRDNICSVLSPHYDKPKG